MTKLITDLNLDNEKVKVNTDLKNSYCSIASEFPLLNKTIRDLLLEKNSSDDIAYVFDHQNLELSYKDVYERVNIMSQSLLDMGFKKGDRFAIILPNVHELIITYLAVSQIGLIALVLSPLYKIVELEYMLKKADPKGVVIYESFLSFNHIEIFRNICPELNSSSAGELVTKKIPSLKHIFVLQNPSNVEEKLFPGTWQFNKLNEILPDGFEHELPYVELDDPCLIMFTSGTSSNPKGALIDQKSLLNNLYLGKSCRGCYLKHEIAIIPIPSFHIYGLTSGIIGPLICENNDVEKFTAVYSNYFPDMLSTIKTIEKYKCNFIRGTPSQFYDLLNHPELKNHDVSSLQIAGIGGSAVLPELVKKIKKLINDGIILSGFGMTELCGGFAITTAYDSLKGYKYSFESSGRGLPFTEVKIVDPNSGKIQPIDTEGELYIRGYNVFKRYWNDPEKTAEAFDENRWFKTGDIFKMDSEGYLYFKSRRSDVIMRGVLGIHPANVERYLKSHPEINNAEVVGVPDEKMGEEVCAWIILEQDSKLTDKDVRDYCKDNIEDHKIPRYIKFVEAFPTNHNNKVMKKKMKEISIKDFNL